MSMLVAAAIRIRVAELHRERVRLLRLVKNRVAGIADRLDFTLFRSGILYEIHHAVGEELSHLHVERSNLSESCFAGFRQRS